MTPSPGPRQTPARTGLGLQSSPRIGMTALTVIFALLAFGHRFGFVGVLIVLSLSALLGVAASRGGPDPKPDRLLESPLYRG